MGVLWGLLMVGTRIFIFFSQEIWQNCQCQYLQQSRADIQDLLTLGKIENKKNIVDFTKISHSDQVIQYSKH
jgi:hypothetical protein